VSVTASAEPVVNRWPKRLGPGEAYGSWAGFIEADGDSSGGTVTLQLKIAPIHEGFRGLWVCDEVTTYDTTNSSMRVSVEHVDTNNKRLLGRSRGSAASSEVASGSAFQTRWKELRVLIEPGPLLTSESMVDVVFATNTNNNTYNVAFFGYVWDLEDWAKNGYDRVYGLHR
jgi:hypothetical protein